MPLTFNTGDPSYLVISSTPGKLRPTSLTMLNASGFGGLLFLRSVFIQRLDSGCSASTDIIPVSDILNPTVRLGIMAQVLFPTDQREGIIERRPGRPSSLS